MWRPSRWSKTDWGTLREVRDGSGDPWGGPERVERPSGRSRSGRRTWGRFATGWETVGEDRDRSRDSRRGPGRAGGHSGRSGTGRGFIGEVWDGSGDPRGGLAWVGRCGTNRETLEEVHDGQGTLGEVPDNQGILREVRDELVVTQGGLGQVGGPYGRFRTGRGTRGEVQERSGDP